jgi:hypothetical protein
MLFSYDTVNNQQTLGRVIMLRYGISSIIFCILSFGLISYGESNSKNLGIINSADYPNLQAAFDAIPETGGIIHLSPGTYEISKPLVLNREDTRIQGSGTATHIINTNESGEPAIILKNKDYENTPDKRQPRVWRVQLADFRISGNPKSGDGILAQGVNEIFIHNMAIDHNGGHGINMIDCYEDPRIADSIITYNKQAGLNILRGHDIVVNGNQFEENDDALRCIDSFNLCMNGNNLDDHLANGVVIENTYGSVVSGNMIEECQGIAVVIDRDCYGITVSSNVIAHNVGGGVDLRDAWGCAVSANTFTIVAKQSITVGPNSGRITITGNNFSNAHIGKTVKRDDEAGGVLLDKTDGITITGNIFSGNSKEAIKTIGTCKNIVLVGNVMMDGSRSKPGEYSAISSSHDFDASGLNVIEKNQ